MYLKAFLLTAALALAAAPAVNAAVLVSDTFGDGDVKTNTDGTGGPYNAAVWSANHSEVTAGGQSLYRINQTGANGNGGTVAWSNSFDGSFDAWNTDGVTSTIQSGDTVVTSAEGSALVAIFGIVDNNSTNRDGNQANGLIPYHNRNGGIWMRIEYTRKTGATGNTDLEVSGTINVAAATKGGDGTSDAVYDTLASFTIDDGWDGQGFRNFQLYVNDQGWQAYVEGTAISWTDDLLGGNAAGNTFGQSWSDVNTNVSFAADTDGHLDDTIFADALANVGLNGTSSGRGTLNYDQWTVETGNQLIPEPASALLLLAGALTLARRRRQN